MARQYTASEFLLFVGFPISNLEDADVHWIWKATNG
jgi:hypothetical protein